MKPGSNSGLNEAVMTIYDMIGSGKRHYPDTIMNKTLTENNVTLTGTLLFHTRYEFDQVLIYRTGCQPKELTNVMVEWYPSKKLPVHDEFDEWVNTAHDQFWYRCFQEKNHATLTYNTIIHMYGVPCIDLAEYYNKWEQYACLRKLKHEL